MYENGHFLVRFCTKILRKKVFFRKLFKYLKTYFVCTKENYENKDYFCETNERIMTVKIPENATKMELDKALAKLDKATKPFDASKYFGKIKFEGDPLNFQRELR